jgi:hypothetical protein
MKAMSEPNASSQVNDAPPDDASNFDDFIPELLENKFSPPSEERPIYERARPIYEGKTAKNSWR